MVATFDDLTAIVNLMVLVCAAVFYTGFFVFWHARKRDYERAEQHLREGGFVMGLLGAALGVMALWGEFTWPLGGASGAYNLYFFDPLVLLGFLLVAFAVSVWYRLPTHFVGMLSVVSGAGVIYYGLRSDFIYGLQLTKEPLETLLLYLAFGAMAILAYPATLYVDWFVTGAKTPASAPLASGPEPAYPRMWAGLNLAFLVLAVLSGIAAVAYGFTIAWAHL